MYMCVEHMTRSRTHGIKQAQREAASCDSCKAFHGATYVPNFGNVKRSFRFGKK